MNGRHDHCPLFSPALPVLLLGLEATTKEASGSREPSLKTTALAQAAQWWEGQCQELHALLPAQREQVLSVN